MDLIDKILQDWERERPDIDCGGKAVVCRILRLYSIYIDKFEARLKPLAITPNVFSVLVTIRRRGPNAEVNVKDIIDEVLVTSGGMSNLLLRIIKTKLIKKRPDPKDARSMLIKLTSHGLTIVDKAMEIQAACEREMVNTLTSEENAQLALLLKKLLKGNA